MIKRIKELLVYWSTNGANLPLAHDVDKGKGSITLLFANTAHYLAVVIIAILAYKDINNGAIAAITYSIITMMLYMMRRLSQFKVNVKEGEIEVDSEDESKEKKDEQS